MIGIYKITNPKGKIYIGQSKNINDRFNSYKKLKHHCSLQPKLFNSLKKYGPENHIFEIIEECSLEQLNEREIYYIDKFKSYLKGLNLTSGGEGCKGYIPTESKRKKHSEIMTGSIKKEYVKEKISKSLKGKQKPNGFAENLSYLMKENNKNKIEKTKILKNPNHYLSGKKRPEWVKDKIKEGMEKNKKPVSKETKEKMSQNRPNKTPILQYTLNNEFIKEWTSQSQAAKFYNIDSTGIYNCCQGKQKTAAGFKWNYKNLN
jgi:group I intron endonuclease